MFEVNVRCGWTMARVMGKWKRKKNQGRERNKVLLDTEANLLYACVCIYTFIFIYIRGHFMPGKNVSTISQTSVRMKENKKIK